MYTACVTCDSFLVNILQNYLRTNVFSFHSKSNPLTLSIYSITTEQRQPRWSFTRVTFMAVRVAKRIPWLYGCLFSSAESLLPISVDESQPICYCIGISRVARLPSKRCLSCIYIHSVGWSWISCLPSSFSALWSVRDCPQVNQYTAQTVYWLPLIYRLRNKKHRTWTKSLQRQLSIYSYSSLSTLNGNWF